MKRIVFLFLVVMMIFSQNIASAAQDKPAPSVNKPQEAIFAMGCFWCGASEFTNHETNEKLPGILRVRVGYTGGSFANPTYENHPGHKEAVKVVFDPKVISYATLLDIFWHNVDPFDAKGQFCDKGAPYTAGIFYQGDDQLSKATKSKEEIEKYLGQAVVTEIKPASIFYDAEEYHQNYKIKNPVRYQYYRWNCGRDTRLEEIWGSERYDVSTSQ